MDHQNSLRLVGHADALSLQEILPEFLVHQFGSSKKDAHNSSSKTTKLNQLLIIRDNAYEGFVHAGLSETLLEKQDDRLVQLTDTSR